MQSSKMKRMEFVYGVTSITVVLLLPIFLQAYGFLDVQEYRSVTNKNSYYENGTEFILTYRPTYYKILLFHIYIFLIVLLVGLICVSSKKKDLIRFQVQSYRPYVLYHCMVCLIPCVLRYANMNAHITDDIMAEVQWKRIFLIMYSIFRFICSYLLFTIMRYKLLRLVTYVFVTLIHSCLLISFVYIICGNSVNLVNSIKESKGEFLTAWSYDQKSLVGKLNVSNINAYKRTFILDENLFRSTGKKLYQTSSLQRLQLKDPRGIQFPYRRQTYNVGIGESVSLSIAEQSKFIDNLSSVFWSLNGSHLCSNNSGCIINTNVNGSIPAVESIIDIDFIDDIGFGNFTCTFHSYSYIGEKLHFQRIQATPIIESLEIIMAQFNVVKYLGREFFIYATPGGVIDIRWKHMYFNSENEDVIQYYNINGAPYNKKSGLTTKCSSLSYLYALYGKAMNWFIIPQMDGSPDILINFFNTYETRFTTCAGSSVFGIHTVEYFRRIYDKKSNSFIFREVKHPDKIYVLPDLPYFYKMDKVTKGRKEQMIKNLQKQSLDYIWFENNHTLFLIARVVLELIVVLILFLLCTLSLCKCWEWYRRSVLQPIRKMILGQPIDEIAEQCSVVRCSSSYCCYVFCGHSDRDSVYANLVVPLRKENILTGFIFEECSINRSGKSLSDIQCDLLKKSEHLIFCLTSAYIEEEKFVDVPLETVLHCIKMGFISTKRVLIIIADNCELPEKLRYTLPEAAANIHDWVTIKDPNKRIRQVLKWIKSMKKNLKIQM